MSLCCAREKYSIISIDDEDPTPCLHHGPILDVGRSLCAR